MDCEPQQRNRMKTTKKRAVVTPAFAGRMLKFYGRKVAQMLPPTAILKDMTSERLSESTRRKTSAAMRFVKLASWYDDRSVHEAMQRLAKTFNLEAPPTPKVLEVPPAPSEPKRNVNNASIREIQGEEGTGEEGTEDAVTIDGKATADVMTGIAKSITAKAPPEPTQAVPTIPPYLTQEGVNRPRQAALACANQLMAKMQAALMATTKHRRFRDRDSGDVDVDTKLPEIAAGIDLDRVFQRTTHAKRLNTAVQIIVDISSSMNVSVVNKKVAGALATRKMLLATECVTILGTVLERLRVPVEILAFNNRAFTVKPWHVKMQQAQYTIDSLSPEGGTNLPTAVVQGMQSLKNRREQRLVQMVITDGDVGTLGHVIALKKANPRLEIFCFGLGVNIRKRIEQSKQSCESLGASINTLLNSGNPAYSNTIEQYRKIIGPIPAEQWPENGGFDRILDNLHGDNMTEAISEQLRDALVGTE
jgi:Mg-chelatase subunit ChlD